MQSVTDKVNNFRRKLVSGMMNPKFLFIIVLLAIFISLAFFVYNKYVAPKLNPDFVPNKEFVQKDADIDEAILYYFRVDWCPICKNKSDPVIKELKEFYEKNPPKKLPLTFITINPEKDEGAAEGFEEKFNINVDGFPSIFLVKGDKIVEFNANPTLDTLKEFINAAL